jgi:hypothetical protein
MHAVWARPHTILVGFTLFWTVALAGTYELRFGPHKHRPPTIELGRRKNEFTPDSRREFCDLPTMDGGLRVCAL